MSGTYVDGILLVSIKVFCETSKATNQVFKILEDMKLPCENHDFTFQQEDDTFLIKQKRYPSSLKVMAEDHIRRYLICAHEACLDFSCSS